MQQFMIGPMCVTKDDFEQQLKKNGFKFGYIKRLYEKWKDDGLTFFRVIIEGCPFVIVTDEENSYPEIQEETGKKIEPYSLEWLENLFYQSTIVGPISYESLLPQLRDYIRVKKAEQIDETAKQNKCPYCHGKLGLEAGFHANASLGKNESGKPAICVETLEQTFYIPIKRCPMCARKLEA
jgi:hypothetical protein